MDKVVLSGLEFHGRHGVFDEEAVFGARFVVDVEMRFSFAPLRDQIEDTANYALVYEMIKEEVTGKRYKLIERLAVAIAERLLSEHALLMGVTVRVHKPHAPIAGIFRDVYAEVVRERA